MTKRIVDYVSTLIPTVTPKNISRYVGIVFGYYAIFRNFRFVRYTGVGCAAYLLYRGSEGELEKARGRTYDDKENAPIKD